MRVEDTTHWSTADIARHGPAITQSLRRYAEAFPDDVTVEGLAGEIMIGAKTMFAVMDGDDVLSVVLVSTVVYPMTGRKVCILHDFGGDRGAEALPLVSVIEDWAREHGCTTMETVVRPGIARRFRDFGYVGEMRVIRKALA